jgi:hypothetical protein
MPESNTRVWLNKLRRLLLVLRALLWMLLMLPGALFWAPWESVAASWLLLLGAALLVHLRRKSLLQQPWSDDTYFDP